MTELVDPGADARWDWTVDHDRLASKLLKLHFDGPAGLSTLFPCMRDTYEWSEKRSPVADSRGPAKNHTEYKGLERHASQYHATAQYKSSSQYWLLAAWWRRADMKAHGFEDSGHLAAIIFCIKNAEYNKALAHWQARPRSRELPPPEAFGLVSEKVAALEASAQAQIDAVNPDRDRN